MQSPPPVTASPSEWVTQSVYPVKKRLAAHEARYVDHQKREGWEIRRQRREAKSLRVHKGHSTSRCERPRRMRRTPISARSFPGERTTRTFQNAFGNPFASRWWLSVTHPIEGRIGQQRRGGNTATAPSGVVHWTPSARTGHGCCRRAV